MGKSSGGQYLRENFVRKFSRGGGVSYIYVGGFLGGGGFSGGNFSLTRFFLK